MYLSPGPLASQPKNREVTEKESVVAVLIDAENTPHEAVKEILDASTRYGRTIIKIAYGDWTTPGLQGWNSVFRDNAIKPVHQVQYTQGKNSTDIAMIIDALDILYERNVDVFILVTSDSDFTALSTRLREEGATVVGMGRQTTPSSFVRSCDHFIPIETLEALPDEEQLVQSAQGAKALVKMRAEGKDLLIRAAKQAADNNGIMTGALLGIVLKRVDPSFSPSAYGVARLADFIALYSDVIVPTGQHSGLDPTYRLVT